MAINVLRAPRRTEDFLVPKSQTSDHVAPGTYSNTHNTSKGLGEGMVPFFSLQEKVLNPNKTASAYTPGPGAYLGNKARNEKGSKANGEDSFGVGSVSMQAKSKRMAPTAPGSSVFASSTIEKNPGPGTYKPESDSLGVKLRKDLIVPVKPVLEALEKTTPSMPPQKLGPGQKPETDSAGVGDVSHLYMRHTGEQRDMVGPGEYDPRGERLTQRTMPQTVFHSSRSERNLFEACKAVGGLVLPKDNPGPGSYEVRGAMADKEPRADSLTEAVQSYQFASSSPMAYQATLSPDKVSPGPGQYDVRGDIERTVMTARERIGSTERAHFGGMSARVGWARDPTHPYKDPYHIHHVPGPGHYTKNASDYASDPKKKEVERVLPNARKKKFHGVHHPSLIMALQEATGPLQAFNSTDDRPCNKETEQRTPAPWQYNREEARAHSMNADLRERAKVGRKGAFGTRAGRFYGSPLEGRAGLPDPVGYEDKGLSGSEPRCMFQSQSPRFHSCAGPREADATKVGNTETPAPGDYLVEREPNYRSPYRTPRKDHLSFGSGQQRFEGSKDVFVGHTPGIPNPGPGEYVARRRERVTGGADMKDRRKPPVVGCTTENVGPGSYGEDMNTHMLRKTFNVSTQVPMGGGAAAKKQDASGFSF